MRSFPASLILSLAVLFATVGCASTRSTAAAPATAASEGPNVAAHRRAYDLFNQHSPAMFDLFTDDIVEHQTSGPPLTGKASLIELNRAFWAGFSDINVDIEQAWSRADYTAVVGRLRGTNDGDMPMLGANHTGRRIDVPFIEVVRWRDGKAAASWPFMDEAALANQLAGR